MTWPHLCDCDREKALRALSAEEEDLEQAEEYLRKLRLGDCGHPDQTFRYELNTAH